MLRVELITLSFYILRNTSGLVPELKLIRLKWSAKGPPK